MIEAVSRCSDRLGAGPALRAPAHSMSSLHRMGCSTRSVSAEAHIAHLIERGEALYAAGDLAAALDCFFAALNRDRQRAPAWNNLGVTLYALGQLEEAETALRAALTLAPNDAPTLTNLACVLQHLGKTAEADALEQQAAALAA
jgi:Flp pilus assembly protein TadD